MGLTQQVAAAMVRNGSNEDHATFDDDPGGVALPQRDKKYGRGRPLFLCSSSMPTDQPLLTACRVLLTYKPEPHAGIVFGQAVAAVQSQLRRLVGELDPALTAQIMVASENILGPAGDVTVK